MIFFYLFFLFLSFLSFGVFFFFYNKYFTVWYGTLGIIIYIIYMNKNSIFFKKSTPILVVAKMNVNTKIFVNSKNDLSTDITVSKLLINKANNPPKILYL